MESRCEELKDALALEKAKGMTLDLTRGKPSVAQLDLSNDLGAKIPAEGFILQDGTDVRNYGGILGIPEARALGGDLLGMPGENVLAGGNSSLMLMHEYVAMMLGAWQAQIGKVEKSDETEKDARVKFLCLVPGFDRHFKICERFNIDMISVPLLADGPDMQKISELVAADPGIKGIWCVPKYSNPTGHTYSDEVVRQFAELPKKASEDFTIFWDNAYCVHHINGKPAPLADIFQLAKKAGTESSIVIFGSTSKITFAGAGLAFMGATAENLAAFEKWLGIQVIGFDKVNQLRHVRFLKNAEGIAAQMKKHQAIIKPKFDLVEKKLAEGLGASPDGKPIAEWSKPDGGYFVAVNLRPGLAGRVVQLAGEAGVKLTAAGATFPYGEDPEDRVLRLAPTYPEMEELERAMDVFVTCVLLATLEAELT